MSQQPTTDLMEFPWHGDGISAISVELSLLQIRSGPVAVRGQGWSCAIHRETLK